MKGRGISVSGLVALPALGLMAACETEPTYPPSDAAEVGLAFVQLAPALPEQGEETPGLMTVEGGCPAGGTVTHEGRTSVEQDGELVIRRVERSTRYEDCGMTRNASVIRANGMLAHTIEDHLDAPDASWPHGVLHRKGHQVGILSLDHGDGDVQACTYDLEEVSEPAAGYVSFKGIACGIPVNRERWLPM